jgi:hypothetical protein
MTTNDLLTGVVVGAIAYKILSDDDHHHHRHKKGKKQKGLLL